MALVSSDHVFLCRLVKVFKLRGLNLVMDVHLLEGGGADSVQVLHGMAMCGGWEIVGDVIWNVSKEPNEEEKEEDENSHQNVGVDRVTFELFAGDPEILPDNVGGWWSLADICFLRHNRKFRELGVCLSYLVDFKKIPVTSFI